MNANHRSPCLALLLAATLMIARAGAAEPRAPEYLGPDGCLACHTKSSDLYDQDLVLFREKDKFLYEDKHAQAFALLQTPLAERILKTLEIDLKNLPQARACLSCHANWISGPKPPDHFTLGVTCESCHGPSSEWDREHRKKESWRLLSAAEKESRGFVNVRDARERARQCLSCHVGDVAQGKVLTHAMYAAGHPPLPGVEVESFAQQMPRHWRYLSEKGEFDLRQEYVRGMYAENPPEFPQTKAVLVSGVMALRQWLLLVSEAAAHAKEQPATWPELAHFDCQACHHDLASPSWRQTRGYAGYAPGRPDMPVWTVPLARAAVGHLAPSEPTRVKLHAEFDGRLEKLRLALRAKPFGNPAAVGLAAEDFAKWLDMVSLKLSAAAYNRAAAELALVRLLQTPVPESLDFQSARQLAWAAKVMAVELKTGPPKFLRPANGETPTQARARHVADVKTYDAWWAGERAKGEQTVEAVFDRLELNEALKLKLPAGQKQRIDEALPANLSAASAYQPAWFQKKWLALGKELVVPP